LRIDGPYRAVTVPLRFLWMLIVFVVISSLIGLVIGLVALPAAVPAGLAAVDASDAFQNVPQDFIDPDLPQRNVIEASDGSVIASAWYYSGTLS
jgi:hypothetical protein